MYVGIGKVRRGAKGVSYYHKLRREDYYLSSGRGEWGGRLAAELGLFGEVDKKDFCALHKGYSPEGEPLGKNVLSPLRRPAFDLTHSLIKDASIIASVNDEWRQRIFNEVAAPAVKVSCDYFEREACFSRRGHNGVELIRGQGFVYSAWNHMVTRSVDGVLDPQAHTHVVVVNACRGEDGQFRTLDSDTLYHHAQAAAALASVEESYQLERLGFQLERWGRSFRIAGGIPDPLREENSKRSRQIREHAGEDASAKDRDRANWATREPKGKVDIAAVLKDWQERNERFGLTPKRLNELASHRLPERDVMKELSEATALAKQEVCRQDSTFTERKFLELTAIECQCRGVRANDVRLHVWAELEKSRRGLSKDLVFLGRDQDGEERWTTRELDTLEKRVLDFTDKTRGKQSLVSKAAVEAAIRRKPTLNPDQADAVRHLALAPGQVKCVVGGAGTGKTYMLDSLREAIEAWDSGSRVIGTSLSSRATRELKNQAHIGECYNIRKLLYEIDRGRLTLDSRTHLFLDEAATTGTRDYARIIQEVAKSGATLYCTGDHRQHQSIEAGGVFLGLIARHPSRELTTIIRQKHDSDKKMVEAFRDREIAKALSYLVASDRLHVGKEVPHAQGRAVKDWGHDGVEVSEKIFITSTNKQVDALNDRCQRLRWERGELLGDGLAIKDGARIFAGDRVVLRRSAPRLDIANGDFGTVITTDKRDELRLRLDDGRMVTIPLKEYDAVTRGYACTSHSSQGGSFTNVYLFVHGRMTDAQTAYVMGSRHTQVCRLYTTIDDAGEDLSKLVRDMSSDRTKMLAQDCVVPPKEEKRRAYGKELTHELTR